MSNEVAVRTAPDIRIFTDEEREIIRDMYFKGSTDAEFRAFLAVAQRTRLDPIARQVYAVKRWDQKLGREVVTTQTSIDGFRLIAERSGNYAGQVGPQWCGLDGVWVDVWLKPEPPAAVRVGVLRTDFKDTLWGVARFDSYKQTTKDGKLTSMWAKMPDLMIAKCGEALALRKAFPQDLSGLYTADEMAQAEATPPARDVAPSPPAQAAQPARPPVNEAPASAAAISELIHAIEARGLRGEEFKHYMKEVHGLTSTKGMTKRQVEEILELVDDTETTTGTLLELAAKAEAARLPF